MSEARSNGAIGARTWAIAEGYIPSASTDSRQPALALLSTVAHPA